MGFLSNIEADSKPKPRNGTVIEPTAYAAAALRGECEIVARATEGTRNDTLNTAALKLGQLVSGGQLPEDVAVDQLTEAARACGLDESEIGPTIRSGLNAGKREPRTDPATSKPATRSPQPRLWRATDLKPATQQQWLARRRVQRGAINLLIGDEGIGKSLLWVWIAAAVTTGKPLPEFGIPSRDPGHVIVVVTEDDWQTTVLPRLIVAEADISMVSVICTEDDGTGAPVFPRDLHLIADAYPAPTLVVVDAWLDTVPSDLNVRYGQDARQALHPWKEVAAKTDAAVLLLTHTNRASSAKARDKYGTTIELRKIARMALYAQLDEAGRLLVGPDKSNNSAPLAASAFTITPIQHFSPTEDDDGTVPKLVYAGESDRTAGQHLAESFDDDRADRQDRSAAERWLSEYLQINPGAKSADVKREAKSAGFSERTLQRARDKLGVIVGYVGMPAVTTWTLP